MAVNNAMFLVFSQTTVGGNTKKELQKILILILNVVTL